MPYETYKSFANCEKRDEYDLMNETIPDLLPGFKGITRSKKLQLLNNFEEVQYLSHDQVLEKEGTMTNYLYWIISGEIQVYKSMDIQFDKQNSQELSIAGVKPLDLFYNP